MDQLHKFMERNIKRGPKLNAKVIGNKD